MDFVFGLPKMDRKHDSNFFVMVRLLKMAHFLPCSMTFDVTRIALIYFNKVVKLHGLSKTIVSNWDAKFTS